jgi:hypothetical protein
LGGSLESSRLENRQAGPNRRDWERDQIAHHAVGVPEGERGVVNCGAVTSILWKGDIINWQFHSGAEFEVTAGDGRRFRRSVSADMPACGD